jgi:cytochrome c peroxidase
MNSRITIAVAILFGAVMLWAGCENDSPPLPPEPIPYDGTPYNLTYGDMPAPDIADDNELTVAKVQLGRMLFYETSLSLDGSMSCSSCHLQANAFSDPDRFSIGVDQLPGKRQAMAVFNLAWNTNEFFWDGRAHLLRDQSLLPIEDPLEMKESLASVVAKLKVQQKYLDQFSRAFGSEEITSLKMSLALENFMNSIVSVNSKYDQFLAGDATLSTSEERGRELFFAEYNPFFPAVSGADCQHCHSGKNFENDKYLNNGLDAEADWTDLGRFDVTGNSDDRAKFKVPSLRNVEVTPPYMHDGRFSTLEEVVEHYNSGIKASSTLDITLENTRASGLMLTAQDKVDLIAFLKTFTDEDLLTEPKYASPF